VMPKPTPGVRLSKGDLDSPPVLAKPGAKPPTVAKPADSSSTTSTGVTRPASPPPTMEKKKFNTPMVGGAKPASTSDLDGELMKKLSVRSAASESDAPELQGRSEPPLPSRPEPALPSRPEPALPSRPAATPQQPPKPTPASAAQKPTVPSVVVVPEPEDEFEDDSPTDGTPKLHHATKDRPKMGSNRRKPQRRSSSVGTGVLQSNEPEEKTSTSSPALLVPTTADAPKPKLPERPVVPSATPASAPSPAKPANQTRSEPQTIPELKEWFQQELAGLKKELQEERTARRALEDRLAKLEARK
jgi:hypothetical protein